MLAESLNKFKKRYQVSAIRVAACNEMSLHVVAGSLPLSGQGPAYALQTFQPTYCKVIAAFTAADECK